MKRNFLIFFAGCLLEFAFCYEFAFCNAFSRRQDFFYKNGTIGFRYREILKGEKPNLFPETPFALKTVSSLEKTENPAFFQENIYHIEKNDDSPSVQEISKILRSISHLKGIQYYSNSRKRFRTLYSSAFMIHSEKDRTPVEDLTEENADGKTFFCILDDSSFGKCVYRLDYEQSEKEVLLTISNVLPVSYKFFTAIKSENLAINIVVSDRGNFYSVYMFLNANLSAPKTFQKRISASLNSRCEAIYSWFLQEMKNTGKI